MAGYKADNMVRTGLALWSRLGLAPEEAALVMGGEE
jgi:hypothetical protein